MTVTAHSPWTVDAVDRSTVDHLAASHRPDPLALELHVDIVADPHREDDDGNVWAKLGEARNVADVVPGSAVVIGSHAGRWLARVLAWDFEVDGGDPIVTMELLPVAPDAVERALARNRSSAS